jgi:hypothetical protein
MTYAIAVGISAGVGFSTEHKLITSYRVLMGYFGAITFVCTVPFFLVQKHRPGQQLPKDTRWWLVGPKSVQCNSRPPDISLTKFSRQVWSAAKSAAQLKQCMLYLVAYFMLNESEFCYADRKVG